MQDNKTTTEMKEKQPEGYASDEQIAAWKSQFKTRFISELISEDPDGTKHVTYFKQPEISHLQMVADKARDKQEMDAMETLFNTLRIGGSDVVLTDFWLKMQCITGLKDVIKTRQAEVKKR